MTTYVPACPGNSPDSSAADSGLCPAAITMCAGTPEPNDVLFWRFTAVRAADGTTGPWQPAGQACLRPQDVPTGAVPAFTVADFRRLPLPASTLHVQPATGRTLVAVPTNLYAAASAQTFDVTLLGLPVRVRATPTAWTWTYGDGSTATRTDPGGPYPDLTAAHTYARPGRYPVSVTTTWSGTYSVAGGPALPVDGTATVSSPTRVLTAVATRAELVADPLD